MKTIPDSGFKYANSFVYNLLKSLEDVLGKNGVKAILNMSGQSSMIDNYPPNDMNPEIDIARYSMIMAALEDMYGDRGAQALALKAGNMLFIETVQGRDPLNINSDAYKTKTVEQKIEAGLIMIQSFVTRTAVPSIPRTADGQFLYIVDHCAVCYGRETKVPRCFLNVGLLQAVIRYSTGGLEFTVTQAKAHSCGDPTCDYIIPVIPNA
jgi:hypothetical protein